MAQPLKIVRTDREIECPLLDHELRSRGFQLVLLPETVSESELADATRDASLILMCYTPITSSVIHASRLLRGIVKYGVGIDAIDIPAAIERSIPVVNVPEYAEETVAEGAFLLLLALAKKFVPIHKQVQTTGWAVPESRWLAEDISGKTVGLVGFGRIGRSMARMSGAGFRARVLAYDPYVSSDDMGRHGVQKMESLAELLSQSDFVSLHCVLNPETRGILSRGEFSAMKPTAFLINVSRGALVDEQALIHALDERRIAGAGLDVYSREPLSLHDHPLSGLFGRDNVLLLPHLTFFTRDAMQRLEKESLERCLEILEGRPVFIKSGDPRLRVQTSGVLFGT